MLANKLDSQVKERAQKMTRAATIGLGLSSMCEDIVCVGVHVCVCVVASVCVCVCVRLWAKFMASHCDIWAHILRQLCSQLATLTEAPQLPPLPHPLVVVDDILKSRVALTFWHCL